MPRSIRESLESQPLSGLVLVLVVSLVLAVLALVCYFVVTPDNVHVAFWISIMAYVVGALGTTVKT
jgi:hypothetical protein